MSERVDDSEGEVGGGIGCEQASAVVGVLNLQASNSFDDVGWVHLPVDDSELIIQVVALPMPVALPMIIQTPVVNF